MSEGAINVLLENAAMVGDTGTIKAKPFVKWAGGKRSIIPQILDHVPGKIKRYYEPFVGGGALFYALESRARKASLSDLNPELMMTYSVVKSDLEKLITLLRKHEELHCKNHYLKTRKQHTLKSAVERAARFIYLNKTCYNGLYRVNKQGKFNVPMGAYKEPMICDTSNLRNVSETLQKVSLRWGGFERVRPKEGDLVYCDPPYDETYNAYTEIRFNGAEQTLLAKKAKEWMDSGAKVIISNSNTELVRNLYRGKRWKLHDITAPRAINCKGSKRKAVNELLIASDD